MILAGALDAASLAAPAEATWIRQRLDSGLVVLAQENPAAPAVAVSVLVRVGSRWESDDNAGITNLLQQVLAILVHLKELLTNFSIRCGDRRYAASCK